MCRSFSKKMRLEEFHILEESQGLTALEKWTFLHYFKMTLLQSRKSFFPFRTSLNIMSRSFSKKMRGRRTSKFFGENRGLTSLEKSTFSYYVKMTFLQSKTPFFSPFRTLFNIMSRSFSKKMRLGRNFKFLRKIMG